VRSRLKKTRRKLDAAVVRSEQSRTALDSDGKAGEAPLHAVSTALRLSQELANVRKLGKSNLHSYRIEIKRLRCVLEMADSDSGPRHQLIGELTEVQDAIGEWHDWLELRGIAHDVLQHGRGCKLLKIIERTTARKFREALQIAEQMRRRYLRPPARGGRSPRQNETVPIAGPLLVAASEIAA
jgi:CHAD domain-containing protein